MKFQIKTPSMAQTIFQDVTSIIPLKKLTVIWLVDGKRLKSKSRGAEVKKTPGKNNTHGNHQITGYTQNQIVYKR